MHITNKNNISLEMAVALLHDEYDYIDAENYISTTRLMKPLRHIILPERIPPADRVVPDVEDYIATFIGSALHASIELSWLDGRHERALQLLGIPEAVIKRVLVNPTPEQIAEIENPIIVYVEQRTIKEITVDGITYKIGGKFDMVCEGRVTDTKSTSVWAWILGDDRRMKEYQLQGSIYRWLNPDKITEDYIRINFIFTDWNKQDAAYKANYPPRRLMHKDIPLLSLEETENWIRTKLSQVIRHFKTPEDKLPECTSEELWMSAPKYKYYSDPTKTTGRSTKNFDNLREAQAFMTEKGKGTIITVPGTPKRCAYCAAFPICSQKDRYNHD